MAKTKKTTDGVISVPPKELEIMVISLISEDEDDEEVIENVNSVSSPVSVPPPNVPDDVVGVDDTIVLIAADDEQVAPTTETLSSSISAAELDYINLLKSIDKDCNFGFSSQDLLDLGKEIIVQRPTRRQLEKQDAETEKYIEDNFDPSTITILNATPVTSSYPSTSKTSNDEDANLVVGHPRSSTSSLLDMAEVENQVNKFTQIAPASQSQSPPSTFSNSFQLSGNTLIVDVSDDEFNGDRQSSLEPVSSSSSSLHESPKLVQCVSPQRKKLCTPSTSGSLSSPFSISSLSPTSSPSSMMGHLLQNMNPNPCQISHTTIGPTNITTPKSIKNGKIPRQTVSKKQKEDRNPCNLQVVNLDTNSSIHEKPNSKQKQGKDADADGGKNKRRGQEGLPPPKNDHLHVYSRTLRLSNLAEEVRRQDISDLFQPHEPIEHIHTISTLGFTFLVMRRRVDASKALKRIQNVKLKNKRIQVHWSPGWGMVGRKWKDFWKADEGVFYIPWSKLRSDTYLKTFEDGGSFDIATLPPFLFYKDERGRSTASGSSNANPTSIDNIHRFRGAGEGHRLEMRNEGERNSRRKF